LRSLARKIEGFQSTLPMRGETFKLVDWFKILSYFNPLSPCGERLVSTIAKIASIEFQSTLPMRGETKKYAFLVVFKLFQSTLPMRGETAKLTNKSRANYT